MKIATNKLYVIVLRSFCDFDTYFEIYDDCAVPELRFIYPAKDGSGMTDSEVVATGTQTELKSFLVDIKSLQNKFLELIDDVRYEHS